MTIRKPRAQQKAQAKNKVAAKRKTAPPPARSSKVAALPSFIAPCLATLARAPPQGSQWVHEIKFDGYRMQAHLTEGRVRLFTRSGLDWTNRMPALAKALAALPVSNGILDGELVVEDERGASSFVRLVEALKQGGASSTMRFYAFDLLFLNGHDTRTLTLLDRKELLGRLVRSAPAASMIKFSEHIAGDGPTMLAEVCKLSLEGIISKRADRPYRSGRVDDWIKSKCLQSEEFVIGGFVASTAMRDAIGALLLGYYDGGEFHYAGRVGTGFTHHRARDLWRILQPLRRPSPAFVKTLTALQRKDVTWVEPRLVAQIEYRTITSDNLLRHAAFKALRDDKPAREVGRPRFIEDASEV